MLPPRLVQIKKAIPACSSVADIGSDHCLLCISLALDPDWRGSRLIATDLNPGPLDRARINLCKHGQEERVVLRRGDGLEPLKTGEVDTVVIAGLGGLAITEMLKQSWEKTRSFNRFLLQPHRNVFELRYWLFKNGFSFLHEDMCRENNHYYFLIAVVPKTEMINWSKQELEVGPLLLQRRHRLLSAYLKEELQELEMIVENIIDSGSNQSRLKVLQNRVDYYREVLKWLAT